MKIVSIAVLLLAWCALFAADDATWLTKAQQMAEYGKTVGSGTDAEEGAYCLVLSRLNESSNQSESDREDMATHDAKRRLTEYIHGEAMSASRKLEQQTVSGVEGKMRNSTYVKRIETRSESFLKALRRIGRVSAKNRTYLVYVATERMRDDADALVRKQAEGGMTDVVRSFGEGATYDEALQRAQRQAIEQVLGTIVVGHDVSETGKRFHSQSRSATDGRIERFEVLSRTVVDGRVKVEITAKVSKENPFDKIVFFVEAPHESVAGRISEIVSASSIRVSSNPDEASYIVRCVENFEDFPFPTTGRTCTRATLSIKVQDIRSKEEYLNVVGGDPVVSKLSSSERRREDCITRALAKIEKPFSEKLPDAIARISRRVLNKK